MYLIYIIKLIILACNILPIYTVDNMKLSNKRSCANKDCSAPISEGKTLLHFSSPTEGVLSFRANQKVTIFSKEAGENTNLWGAEIDGKRGYVPKRLIREGKILFKGPLGFLENVEELSSLKKVPDIKPDSVKEPYEVIDGTTVYSVQSEEVISVTEAVIDKILPQVETVPVETNNFVLKTDSDSSLLDSIKPPKIVESDVKEIEVAENTGSDVVLEEIPEIIIDNLEEKLNETFEENKIEKVENNFLPEFADINENVSKSEESIQITEIGAKENVEAEIITNLNEPILNIIDTIEKKENVEEVVEVLNDSINLPTQIEPEIQTKLDNNEVSNETSKETIETVPPSFENVPPSFENDPPSFENVPPSFENDPPSFENIPPSFETVPPSFENDPPSFETENNSFSKEQYESNETDQNVDYALNLEEFSEEVELEFALESEINDTEENNERNEEITKETEATTESEEKNEIVEEANDENILEAPKDISEESEGFFSKIFSNLFGSSTTEDQSNLSNTEENLNKEVDENLIYNEAKSSLYQESGKDYLLSNIDHGSCSLNGNIDDCDFNKESLNQPVIEENQFPSIEEISNSLNQLDFANFFDIILVLSITGGTTAIFFIAYLLIDKCRKEAPLIAKINQLEKVLLVTRKENLLLAEKSESDLINTNLIDRGRTNEEIVHLQSELQNSLTEQDNLQEQIQSLEKELENSAEVGLELNKMISDMLMSSQNGSDVLTQHVKQLQNQLVDQHNDIGKYKEKLTEKTTENNELQLENDINKKKVHDLQTEIDCMLLNVLKIEEERDENQQKFKSTLADVHEKLQQDNLKFNSEIQRLNSELQKTNKINAAVSRNFEIKSKELDLLKDSIKEVKAMKNNSETLKSLLDMSSVKAELHQLKTDNVTLNNSLQVEQQKTYTFEKQAEIAIQEAKLLKVRFDEADKEKVEAQTKLEVLGSYFKEKESQLQKELSKHESMWNEKQGEASSTVERIKFMQEELQNYKSQNETLKHEIMAQEVDLKSQISVLEKKSHEFWLNTRQIERKLEDSKQEAAQLRNRLTLQERSFMDDKSNGTMEHPLSPLHHMGGMDHNESGLNELTSSPPPPPMLYGGVHRDHMTASPHNLHSMPPPPPFLPPPPFMPPPPMNGPPAPLYMHHGLPAMPPPLTQGPSGMFGPPGDHRPPPLGRISSPPLPDRVGRNHRSADCYSPSTYSPYDDRRTPPSPSYDDDDDDDDLEDDDDDRMYNSRRDGGGHDRRYYGDNYRLSRHLNSPPPPPERQSHRSGARNGGKGSALSSGGSANSNNSVEKGNSNASTGQYHHNTNV